MPHRRLTIEKLNKRVVAAEYAVRGKLALRAEALRDQLKTNPESLPFKQVINSNIGNPQQLDQKPITFYRQVLALVQYPDLLKSQYASELFKKDAIERAKTILAEVGSVGAYSHSKGIPHIRKSVAKFIEKRDGFPADPESIFLTAGASSAVNYILSTLAVGPRAGFLIPIPQYPLYSATLTLLDSTPVPYHLDEKNDWATNAEEIDEIIQQSRKDGLELRVIVVINPGNPTGAVLTEENIASVIKVAAKEGIVIMADEVYQANIYKGKFVSFKQVLRKLQQDEPGVYDHVHLVSLHSTSKGMIGECGQRGGYMELVGFSAEVENAIYKLTSISLCPVVTGQILVELMVNPPVEGDDSFFQFQQEYRGIYNTLKHRASVLFDAFKSMKNVEVNEPEGAMYLFPKVNFPAKAIEAAKAAGENVDEFYCMKLLEATGICVIPGTGFGQANGTWHFRTTFLAPGDEYAADLVAFHNKFIDEYS